MRVPIDFVKALALGADGAGLSSSAMQAIGSVGARMCNTNNCPSGIATQKPEFRARLNVDLAAQRLQRFFAATTELMQVMARASGHGRLADLRKDDLATWHHQMARLSGIRYSGFVGD